MHRLRAAVLEGQPLVRAGIVSVLRDMEAVVVTDAPSIADAAALLPGAGADLVLVGDAGDGAAIATAVAAVRARAPEALVVALVPRRDREGLLAVLDAGAVAVVPHDADREELVSAISAARRGEHHLSPSLTATLFATVGVIATEDDAAPSVLTRREHAVVRLVAEGRTNDEIGTRLYISSATVKTHLSNAYEKLGARNRYDAVVKATQRGLL
jgi:DNA-binding NarL/FixJ family response regulator